MVDVVVDGVVGVAVDGGLGWGRGGRGGKWMFQLMGGDG